MGLIAPFDYFQHRQDCQRKQTERTNRLARLPPAYHAALTPSDHAILSAPIADLVRDVQTQRLQPLAVLQAYGKAAVRAHGRTNCLTEILFPEAEAACAAAAAAKATEAQAGAVVVVNLKGPLAGVPVSLKDSVAVGGADVTIGYSRFAGCPVEEDGAIVKLLKQAGAIPFVKTNLPITLLSFESSNDLWGRTLNPHNPDYSPGGSTGGEAALLACGGSRIGIGSDVAGSVRVPAHWSGCYSLRCSVGRWPKLGIRTSMAGQEGIQSVFSPMARTLDDLQYFTREFIKMKPWRVDPACVPLEWRDDVESSWADRKVLKVGIMRSDGVVPPSPACARALDIVVNALRVSGHEVHDVSSPPSPYQALLIASQLLNADGCSTFSSYFRSFEKNDPGAAQLSLYMHLPRFVKYLHYLWVKYVRRDDIWAGLLRGWSPKSADENWKLVVKREEYKVKWMEWWDTEDLDILITPPNATPALPHGAMHDAVSSCGYTFLFNLLDYTAGIMPVTKVDAALDQLPTGFNIKHLNGVARGAYKHYDASKMAGLPVGIQVVGRRLEEEKVLAIMNRIEASLEAEGQKYELLNILD